MNATDSHPSPDIAAALDACRKAGLTTVRGGDGPIWGWVECATGARRISVPARTDDPGRQRTRLLTFLDSHVTHRVRKRPAPRVRSGR
ncbi:hypothetical protein [Catenuloplanes japonicus]|uniref:hypothetical protein n=1 Tax=Catenuloplanes japonicus TaxID=33876 RepID=UPI000524CDCF|nr:hypothetical protein [Catenuloplanes japonicus]